MLFGIISCLKGSYTVKATGKFPERVLNIASTSGIYVYAVKRISENSLSFSLSKKGAEKLLSLKIEGLELTITEKSGFPVFLNRYKKRFALISLPVLFLIATCIFSLFIWKVNITGGDKELRSQVEKVIRENGVYTGALKHKIDRYDVKRKAIIGVDSLSWLWVDIKGTTAHVKIQPRKDKPELLDIKDPADVISLYTGVIEKMQVYCGISLFSEGMTVEKGQTIVTGVLRSENENIPTYYHHACADVTLRVNESKTYIIPKKTVKKVPTGHQKTVFSLNFKKNNIKFSLNSGISYHDYDKIEKTAKLPFLPFSFSKTTYKEAKVTREDTDLTSETEKHKQSFSKSLEENGMKIMHITQTVSESPDALKVTFNAECLVRADKEIPIAGVDSEKSSPTEKGEQYGKIY